MEAVKQGCLKCIKDLGGGGLSCCLSETSDNLGKGFDIELTKIHTRESHMMPNEPHDIGVTGAHALHY